MPEPRNRATTASGLIVAAMGISILWAIGQDFPVYPPPGIVMLAVGAAFVWWSRWRWAPLVAAALGLSLIVGFVLSGLNGADGFANLARANGTGRQVGQVVQLIGALGALVVGIAQTRSVARASRAARTLAPWD